MKQLLLPAACLMAASCERFTPEVSPGSGGAEAPCNVVLHVSDYVQGPFDGEGASRASRPVSEACTRIDCAFYDGDSRVASVRQDAGDEGFGTLRASLGKGEYRVVVVAHSGAGHATLSTPERITFKDNKVTDTFYYYGTIDVGEGETTGEVGLTRAVAMFRLVIDGEVPAQARGLKFYYTGGSSTLDAVTGRGCVNSRQTETRDLQEGRAAYEVYTFPHEEEDVLQMTVTPLDADGGEMTPVELPDVPVTRNRVTYWQGNPFGGSGTGSGLGYTLLVDDGWAGEDRYPN